MVNDVGSNSNSDQVKANDTSKGFELLDKGIDILKVIFTNNASVVKSLCDTVTNVSKSIENSINTRAQNEIKAEEERRKVLNETRQVILDELQKEGLTKEDYHKLLDLLDKNTPKEEAIQAITRGTSVAKTAFYTTGIITVALLALKKKK